MSGSRDSGVPSAGWMLGMSAWMISAFIPGSYLAWLGFLIVGIVGRMLRWTVAGVVLGVLAIVVHLPLWGQWQPLVAGIVYIAGMVMALMANPGWLRAMWARRTGGEATSSASSSTGETRATRRARQREEARASADAARDEASAREEARQAEQRRQASRSRSGSSRSSSRASSSSRSSSSTRASATSAKRGASRGTPEPSEADQLAARAGASSAEFFAAPAQSSAEAIDVNTADAGALATLPGITSRLARKLVKQRTDQGGFASLDAFATAAGLQPHELVRLRTTAVCSRPPRGPRQFGRRVDY